MTDAAVLTAHLSDVTGLANLLKSVSIQTHAVVTASESGLEIVTELNRTLQAHAYLYSHMFDTYEFRPPASRQPRVLRRARSSPNSAAADSEAEEEPDTPVLTDEPPSVSFEVSLETWLSCLDIFGGVGPSRPQMQNGFGPQSRRAREGTTDVDSSSRLAQKATQMKLTYQGVGNPLVMELEQEPSVVTRCSISTYEPSFLTDMVFDKDNMVAQVILGSELMHSAFSEVDPSCKKLSILMTSSHTDSRAGRASSAHRPNMLRLKAISDSGSSEMEFPANTSSSDPIGVIEKFIAKPESTEQWYDFTLLSQTMTVLKSSLKTSIRINDAGLLSYQFIMPRYRKGPTASVADGEDAHCEFLCCPLDPSTLVL